MRVLMQGRFELMESGGGDKVQIENTAEKLRKLGVEVDIITRLAVDYSKYDLVHLFQLDWTPETYLYAKKVKQKNKPLVVSPIHHQLDEVKRFDDEYVFDFRRISKLLFSDQHHRDTLKNVYRSVFNPAKMLMPTIVSILKGLKNMHTEVLDMADYVLVQTDLEAQDLKNIYAVDFKWRKVPNGVGEQFISLHEKDISNPFDFEDYIICVGRIEARKNQLNLIKAVDKLRDTEGRDIRLVLVGKKSRLKHFEFMYSFNKLVSTNDWVIHVPEIAYVEMPSYYSFAKVGVSVSWFESTGLTSLEALFCGTNAVATGKPAQEYLGDLASYCDPGDVDSILDALRKEYYSESPNVSGNFVEEYTWENAAHKTLDVYKEVLGRP